MTVINIADQHHADYTNLTFTVTLFKNVQARSRKEWVGTRDQLAEMIRNTDAPNKESAPLLKLGTYGNKRSDKGALRWDGNFEFADGVEGDYDDGKMSVDEAVNRLRARGMLAIVFTSPSHRPDAPRWRVLAPTSVRMEAADRERQADRLNGALGGVLAGETWTRSQAFYYGRVTEHFRLEVIDGRPIDLLALPEIPKRLKAGPQPGDIDELPEKLRKLIVDGPGEKGTVDRSSKGMWRVACALVRHGWSDAQICAVLLNREYRVSEHVYDQNDPESYAAKNAAAARAAVEADWQRDQSGQIDPKAIRNFEIALTRLGVTLEYNEFASRAMIDRKPLNDPAVDKLWVRVQKEFNFRPTNDDWFRYCNYAAREKPYHPVREYLRGLNWKGKEQLPTWLCDHAGAADTPFNRAVGTCWMIGAVARVMEPGCLMKNVLSLEGRQDLAKSKMLATLVGNLEWFTDHLSDLTKKDAKEEVQGKWIIEFAEFDALRRAESARIKAFLSTRIDHFRPSYGRLAEDFPRQWVGVVTINPGGTGYLRDETGGVRFWPVECAVGWEAGRQIDCEELAKVRNQLWAEAVARYDRGEKWWLVGKSLRLAHEALTDERQEDDPREPMVRAYINGKAWVDMHDLLLQLGYPTKEQDRAVQTAVGGIMKRLKWQRWRGQHYGPKGPGYYYFPPTVRDVIAYAKHVTKQQCEPRPKQKRKLPMKEEPPTLV